MLLKGEPLDPQWEPNLPPPKPYSGEFDRCRGFLGQCQLMFRFQPSRFRSDWAKVALILSSLTDQALDWDMAAVGSNPQLSSDLAGFSEEFRWAFDHPTNGADMLFESRTFSLLLLMLFFHPSLIPAVPPAVPPSLPVPARDYSSSTSLIPRLQPANPPAAPVSPRPLQHPPQLPDPSLPGTSLFSIPVPQ